VVSGYSFTHLLIYSFTENRKLLTFLAFSTLRLCVKKKSNHKGTQRFWLYTPNCAYGRPQGYAPTGLSTWHSTECCCVGCRDVLGFVHSVRNASLGRKHSIITPAFR